MKGRCYVHVFLYILSYIFLDASNSLSLKIKKAKCIVDTYVYYKKIVIITNCIVLFFTFLFLSKYIYYYENVIYNETRWHIMIIFGGFLYKFNLLRLNHYLFLKTHVSWIHSQIFCQSYTVTLDTVKHFRQHTDFPLCVCMCVHVRAHTGVCFESSYLEPTTLLLRSDQLCSAGCSRRPGAPFQHETHSTSPLCWSPTLPSLGLQTLFLSMKRMLQEILQKSTWVIHLKNFFNLLGWHWLWWYIFKNFMYIFILVSHLTDSLFGYRFLNWKLYKLHSFRIFKHCSIIFLLPVSLFKRLIITITNSHWGLGMQYSLVGWLQFRDWEYRLWS